MENERRDPLENLWATKKSVDDLNEKTDRLLRIILGDKESGTIGLLDDVRTIKGWLVGELSPTGVPTIGVLQMVATLWRDRRLVIGFLGTITTAVVVNTCLALWQFYLSNVQHITAIHK